LLLRPFAHVGCANGVHCPMISLPMCDEGADTDNRVVDVLRELVANRFANFYVGPANKVVGGRKPAEVGHGLKVPDDDAWLHAGLISTLTEFASLSPFGNCKIVALVCRAVNWRRAASYKRASPLPA